MADAAPTTPFVMNGARDAIASGLAHIEEQVRSIELAVVKNPALAFDLARTIVETACRTILTERKIAYSASDDLPKLFRTVSNHLQFLPPAASSGTEVRNSLTRILNGLGTAIQGICELRNQCGFASHGSDKPRPPLESVQALLVAEAADTIVGFLHRVHRQDRTSQPSQRVLYETNAAFNDWVDEQHGPIRIFESEFRASEVLFQMETESYRIYLADFVEDTESAETESGHIPEVKS